MKRVLGGCILLLAVFFLLAARANLAQSRIAVPSYQDPGSSQWNAWSADGPNSVGMMIVNLNNGDDTSYQANIDQAIRSARKKGIFVVGYVYTGYGKRDPSVVHKKIDAVFQNYLVDGIFFDEVPTDCYAANPHGGTNYSYYQQLAEYVRRDQVGGRIVVLNPGTQPSDDCWMSIANILVTAESSSLKDYKTNYQDQAWFHQFPPNRFWHIVYAVPTTSQMNKVLALSTARGAGWVYVTDKGSANSNPYAKPPAYWALESSAVSGQGVQSPYATFRPQSNDENGNPVASRASFRWTAVNGAGWQIFLDTDVQNHKGYGGSASGLTVDADFLVQAGADGSAHLFRYAGEGTDWNWTEVEANADAISLESAVKLVELDASALGGAHSLRYQIRSLDKAGHSLYTGPAIPMSLNNTDYTFDIQNH